jgi:hypothetical protein
MRQRPPSVRGPGVSFGRVWNWKSAVVSASMRAPIFFAANLEAGMDAATAAFFTEFSYRVVSAGFYGALTGFFARRRARRAATVQALIVLPALAHAVEYVVHWFAGTPHIATAMAGSVAMSMATTRLSLFLMRRGLFVAGGQSFATDVRELSRLVARPLMRRPAGLSADGSAR